MVNSWFWRVNCVPVASGIAKIPYVLRETDGVAKIIGLISSQGQRPMVTGTGNANRMFRLQETGPVRP
jgi:hypothetical protein